MLYFGKAKCDAYYKKTKKTKYIQYFCNLILNVSLPQLLIHILVSLRMTPAITQTTRTPSLSPWRWRLSITASSPCPVREPWPVKSKQRHWMMTEQDCRSMRINVWMFEDVFMGQRPNQRSVSSFQILISPAINTPAEPLNKPRVNDKWKFVRPPEPLQRS